MRTKYIALGLASYFLLAPLSPLSAETLSEKQDALKQQAEQTKQKINETNKKIDDVSDKMRALQDDWIQATNEYKQIKSQLDDSNAQLDKLAAELEANQQQLNEHIVFLQRRVRDIYMHGQVSYLDVLFGAEDFSDFINRVNIIKRILNYDYHLIKNILNERKLIEQNKAKQLATKQKIEELYTQASAKKAVLDEKKAALVTMREKLLYDKKTSENAYAEIQAASERIRRMIQQSHSTGSSVVGTGQMIWPINGPITSPFGWRHHPIYGTARFHSGIDIGGDYGDPIHAADSGTVTYAGWISGYGYTVMIDHGRGIVSLYGHNQSLNVHVGQNVAKGDTISFCGSTGNSTGPHCHFEVRVHGEPTNPLNFL